MTATPPLTGRSHRILLELDRLVQSPDLSIDTPEAHVSWLVSGIAGLSARIVSGEMAEAAMTPVTGIPAPQFQAFAVAMLGEVDRAGGDMLSALHAASVAALAKEVDQEARDKVRNAIARIVDDEIWDGDGDYPLDRKRIADRREKAYAKADAILVLLQGR